MREGMSIEARTPKGTIGIRAGSGYYRTYTWGGCSKTAWLEARPARWHGSKGISNEGYMWFIPPWFPCEGIYRPVVEEGQQHLQTEEEALSWLRSRGFPVVYRNDGLAVGWMTWPPRGQLNVEVWQIYIGGRKPEELQGADDSLIKVEG